MKKYSQDNSNKVISGKVKYINLPQLLSSNTKSLAIDEFGNLGTSPGGATTVTSANITDATATGRSVLTAASAADARAAIGAGTSNLTIGTTASTAKAGNYVPTYAEVTGKPSTFAPSAHTHAIADVTGLQTALDGKQASGSYATSTELTNGLAGKANTSHTHTIANVTGLQTALDGKQASLPVPPETGIFVLTSTDGVLSWEAQA